MSKKSMCWIAKCTSQTNKCRVKKEINQANPSVATLEKRWKNVTAEVTCGGSINTHMLIVFLLLAQQHMPWRKYQCQKKEESYVVK